MGRSATGSGSAADWVFELDAGAAAAGGTVVDTGSRKYWSRGDCPTLQTEPAELTFECCVRFHLARSSRGVEVALLRNR